MSAWNEMLSSVTIELYYKEYQKETLTSPTEESEQ